MHDNQRLCGAQRAVVLVLRLLLVLACGLFPLARCQLLPANLQPPVPGPDQTFIVPHSAFSLSATSECSGEQDIFFLPSSTSFPRFCRTAEQGLLFQADNVLVRNNGSRNPQQFWRTAQGDKNATLTLKFSQSFSVVSVSFVLHAAAPSSTVVRRPTVANQSEILSIGVTFLEDCETIFSVPQLPSANTLPQCVSVPAANGRVPPTYPLRVEFPVVDLSPDPSTLSNSFLEARSVTELSIDFTGIGKDAPAYPFVAVSDLEVRGRCLCNGHAQRCALRAPPETTSSPSPMTTTSNPDQDTGNTTRPPAIRQAVADVSNSSFYTCLLCLHQTTGDQCERCARDFTLRPQSPSQECIGVAITNAGEFSIVGNAGEGEFLQPPTVNGTLPAVNWSREGVPIVSDLRVRAELFGLRISQAMESDSSRYTADVQTGPLTLRRTTFNLCILSRGFSRPYVSFPIASVQARLAGSSSQLVCEVVSLPGTAVTWFRSSRQLAATSGQDLSISQTEPIADGNLGEVRLRSVLTLNSVIVGQDSGVYTCMASFLPLQCAGLVFSANRTARLSVCQVVVRPLLATRLGPGPVSFNASYLACDRLSTPTIQFVLGNGSVVLTNDRLVSSEGRILVLVLPRIELGYHDLTMVVTLGDVVQESALRAAAFGPPTIRATSPRRSTSIQGQAPPVRFTFEFTGIVPDPVVSFIGTFRWHLNGHELNRTNDPRFLLNAESITVRIPTVDIAGTYTINIINDLGSATLDFVLDVLLPPHIFNTRYDVEPLFNSFGQRSPANVSCTVDGLPAPSVYLRGSDGLFMVGEDRDGTIVTQRTVRLPNSLYRVEVNLMLPAVASSNNTLICSANSSIGTVSTRIFSLIQVLGEVSDIRFASTQIISPNRLSVAIPLLWTAAPTSFTNVVHDVCIEAIDVTPTPTAAPGTLTFGTRAAPVTATTTASPRTQTFGTRAAPTTATAAASPRTQTFGTRGAGSTTATSGRSATTGLASAAPTFDPAAPTEDVTQPPRRGRRQVTRPLAVATTSAPSATRMLPVQRTQAAETPQLDLPSSTLLPDAGFFPPPVAMPLVTAPPGQGGNPRAVENGILPSTCTVVRGPVVLTIDGVDQSFPALIRNLARDTLYGFRVQTRPRSNTNAGQCSRQYVLRTPPGRPFPPEKLNVLEVGHSHVFLQWRRSDTLVGPITHYNVTVSGAFAVPLRRSTVSVVPVAPSDDIARLNFTGLPAATELHFTVTSYTDDIRGDSTGVDAKTLGIVIPPPAAVPNDINESDYRASIPTRFRRFSSTQLTWRVQQFDETSLQADFYQIIITRRPRSLSVSTTPAESFGPDSPYIVSYDEAHNASAAQFLGYVAGEIRRQDFDGGVAYFTGGNGTVQPSQFLAAVVYENLPLQPFTIYNAFVRALVRRTAARGKRQSARAIEEYNVVTGPFLREQTTDQEAEAEAGPTAAVSSVDNSSLAGPIVGAVFGGAALLIVLFILLLSVVSGRSRIYNGKKQVFSSNFRYSRKRKSEKTGDAVLANPMRRSTDLEESTERATVTTAIPLIRLETEVEQLSTGSSDKSGNGDASREPIPVQLFDTYVQRVLRDEYIPFDQEYSALEDQSPVLDNSYCQKPELFQKNRFASVVAANHSRVVLPNVSGHQFSDYINANYINGFECKREFIATQGPVEGTCGDFWRMVWHNEVETIVMLTRLTEKGSDKCQQYWPTSGTRQFGDSAVTLVDAVEQSDFIICTLRISMAVTTSPTPCTTHKYVKHFRFTSWPDSGVPILTTPLLHFLQRIRAHQPRLATSSSVPILVHCSGGIGRTGTVIALDSLLNQAELTGMVDPFGFVLQMREQRTNMVQTREQYSFLHRAVRDALHFGKTLIGPHQVAGTISQLLSENAALSDSGVQHEFELLEACRQGMLPTNSASMAANQSKNGTMCLPYDHNRVKLPSLPGIEGADYINASYIDGWNVKHQYIATESPSRKTVSQFWSMILQERIAVVFAMEIGEKQDDFEKMAYWPRDYHRLFRIDKLTITLRCVKHFSSVQSTSYATLYDLRVRDEVSEQESDIGVFHVRERVTGTGSPLLPDPVDMLLVIGAAVARQAEAESSSPILLHCRDGSSLTGVLIALLVCKAQLRSTGCVDVLQAVSYLRAQRTDMVPQADLYRYIYLCILESLRMPSHPDW